MKHLIIAAVLSCSLFLSTTHAQNQLTTLVRNGETTPFYGINSFVEAYNASENGDILYLSPGFFLPPQAIAKSITVIGAGHFPDSAGVAKRTTITGWLTLNNGADNLHLEGLYINSDINFQRDASINFVKVLRSRFNNANFNSDSADAAKNNCSFEECFLDNINFSAFGDNLLVRNSIIQGGIGIVNANALIEGNVLLVESWGSPFNVNSSTLRNNIFVNSYGKASSGMGCILNNNIFVSSEPDFGNNAANNNYIGIPQESIFVNQSGNEISYEHDYHLKNPETFLSSDGSQVGIYGGAKPFKDGGIPSNPQIIVKEVANQTDEQGNLQIRFTVKAQDR